MQSINWTTTTIRLNCVNSKKRCCHLIKHVYLFWWTIQISLNKSEGDERSYWTNKWIYTNFIIFLLFRIIINREASIVPDDLKYFKQLSECTQKYLTTVPYNRLPATLNAFFSQNYYLVSGTAGSKLMFTIIKTFVLENKKVLITWLVLFYVYFFFALGPVLWFCIVFFFVFFPKPTPHSSENDSTLDGVLLDLIAHDETIRIMRLGLGSKDLFKYSENHLTAKCENLMALKDTYKKYVSFECVCVTFNKYKLSKLIKLFFSFICRTLSLLYVSNQAIRWFWKQSSTCALWLKLLS